MNLPSDALVPRIPQRLNYLLLVQDVLKANGLNENVIGIDIGLYSKLFLVYILNHLQVRVHLVSTPYWVQLIVVGSFVLLKLTIKVIM